MTCIKMHLTGVTAVLICLSISLTTSKYKQIEIDVLEENEGEKAKVFSESELKAFDGSNPNEPVYLAVRGVVFDVSAGKDFYGKGAAYNQLAGKDASYAIAKWSLEDEDMHHDLSTLSDDELKGLDDVYLGTYKKKYPIVGYMEYLVGDKVTNRFRGAEL